MSVGSGNNNADLLSQKTWNDSVVQVNAEVSWKWSSFSVNNPALFLILLVLRLEYEGQPTVMAGLLQERRNSSALAVELRLSSNNPSVCRHIY